MEVNQLSQHSSRARRRTRVRGSSRSNAIQLRRKTDEVDTGERHPIRRDVVAAGREKKRNDIATGSITVILYLVRHGPLEADPRELSPDRGRRATIQGTMKEIGSSSGRLEFGIGNWDAAREISVSLELPRNCKEYGKLSCCIE